MSKNRLVDPNGQPVSANGYHGRRRVRLGGARAVRGGYDAAQTTTENSAHWAAADSLDADSANSLAVRKKIRERARLEVANNPVLEGIVHTQANYEVGTGPSWQVQSGDDLLDRVAEEWFAAWAEAVGLAQKLWTAAQARVTDGEAFLLLVYNESVDHEVKLDLVGIECDQCTSPFFVSPAENYVDGVLLDALGNPWAYDILTHHPGGAWGAGSNYTRVAADRVIHWFRCDRPGQHRGVSELRASLGILPGVRRFNGATIKAAETAADIAVFFETDLPPGMEPDEVEEEGAIEIPMGTMMQAPFGHKAKQIAATHPNDKYGDFLWENHGQAARPLNMPRNIAMCDSSRSNMASGQLDHLTYFAGLGVTQTHTNRQVLRKIVLAWWAEAARTELGRTFAWPLRTPKHQWHWTGRPYANVLDEANAIAANLADGNTTFPLEYARRGLDCTTEWTKQAQALGMSLDEYQRAVRKKLFGEAAGGDGQAGQAPLNGAQITAALEIVVKLREQTIPAEAATELLAGLGIERAKAEAVVASVPRGLDTTAGDVGFKREVLKALLNMPAAREAVYNGTDIEDLITQTGLSPERDYEVPWIPVVAPTGPLVSGDTITDPEGDTVGGDLVEPAESEADGQTEDESDEMPMNKNQMNNEANDAQDE